jgi:hypothetical protein
MSADRKTARIAGVLFITATAASIGSVPFLAPINDPNYLVSVSVNANQVATGVLFSIIAALASASIAISMYPVLRRYSQGLAIGAVGLRLIEGVFYLGGVVSILSLLTLSQEFVKAGSPDSGYYQTLGALTLAGYHWAGNVVSLLAFCLGAMLYYIIFYQTKLVPRWLSIWGLVGVALGIVAGLLGMFQLIGPLSTPQAILALPIAVQEMALAIWLIVKGFNPSAIASESA